MTPRHATLLVSPHLTRNTRREAKPSRPVPQATRASWYILTGMLAAGYVPLVDVNAAHDSGREHDLPLSLNR
jgi:hypothetical protein